MRHGVPDLLDLLRRHATGGWGELDEDDKQANDEAITGGERILSSYRLTGGSKLWINTERDRSATTAVLPDDY